MYLLKYVRLGLKSCFVYSLIMNWKKTKRYIFFLMRHRRKIAGGFIFNKNHVLIVFGEKWGPPKGHCFREETYIEAAKRELFEEVGIKFNIYHKNPYIMIKSARFYLFTTNIPLDQKLQPVDTREIKNIRWVSRSELTTTFPNNRFIEPLIRNWNRLKRIASKTMYSQNLTNIKENVTSL